MTKEALGVLRRNGREGLIDCRQEGFMGSGFCLSQVGFYFRPHGFNGIEIRAVSRKEEESGSLGLDEVFGLDIPMRSEVVTDDNVVWLEGWTEHMPHIFSKDFGVRGSLDDHAGCLTGEANGPQHRRGLPMTAGSMVIEALAVKCPAPQASHIGFGAGFIQKDQTINRHLLLSLLPEFSLFENVRSILFAGPQRFF